MIQCWASMSVLGKTHGNASTAVTLKHQNVVNTEGYANNICNIYIYIRYTLYIYIYDMYIYIYIQYVCIYIYV